jgi:DUF971 family protein
MIDPPTNIRAHQADQALELVWPDGTSCRLRYLFLRSQCPCASCRDEWSGERILDPATIPADLKLEGLHQVGNYAIQLSWSDGHGSGIFTWELLRDLAAKAPEAAPAKWQGIDPPPG